MVIAKNGYSIITVIRSFQGETPGPRCDRKFALLGGEGPHLSTPYVGDKCVRTRWKEMGPA